MESQAAEYRTYTFSVHGMDCSHCASSIQDALPRFAALPGGCSMPYAHVSFADAQAVATVKCGFPHPSAEAAEAVKGEIELQGFQAQLLHVTESAGLYAAEDATQSLASSVFSVADGFAEACPWLLIGIFTTIMLKWLSSPLQLGGRLSGHLTLGDDAGAFALLTSCVKATLLGLVCPLCSCGAVPLAMGLSRAGVAPAAMLAFLLAAQSSGLDSAMLTWGLLGGRIALCRLLGSSLLAISAGLAVGRTAGSSSPRSAWAESATSETSSLISTLATSAGICADLAPPLFVGVLLTRLASPLMGAVKQACPSSFLDWAAMAGPGRSLALRALLVVSALPLQVCEHSVVTFARAIQHAGATAGTSFAFMLVAPATNAATVLLLLRHSSDKNGTGPAVRAVSAIVTVSVLMSLAVDWLESSGVEATLSASASASAAASTSSPGLFSGLCGYVTVRWGSFILVCGLAVGDYASRRLKRWKGRRRKEA